MLDAWRLGVETLTAIPMRAPTTDDRRRASAATVLSPAAVLIIGVAVTCVALTGHGLTLPVLAIALLAIGAGTLRNRASYLDGVADAVGGLAACYDRERSLVVGTVPVR